MARLDSFQQFLVVSAVRLVFLYFELKFEVKLNVIFTAFTLAPYFTSFTGISVFSESKLSDRQLINTVGSLYTALFFWKKRLVETMKV